MTKQPEAPRHCAGEDYSKSFEQYKDSVLNKVARFDFDVFNLPKDGTILDVGCSFGDRIRMLEAQGHSSLLGIDIDPHCIEASGMKNLSVGSITETGLGDQVADAVLVENVFHHIEDYSDAVTELARVLKPGGRLCFIEPRAGWARGLLDWVTFSTPAPAILRGPFRLRYEVMGVEMTTGLYPLWLQSEAKFFEILKRHFEVTWRRNSWLFLMVSATKRSS